MSDVITQMQAYTQAVEEFLAPQFTQDLPQKQLLEAMRYSLLAGGKRIRPVLCLEFCRVCGGDWKTALPFACALEMIHTYSLIHDDLPSMDNDDFRRGRPTNHKVFGEAGAILAGDALLTAAFEMAASAKIDGETAISAIRVLAACAGEKGMVGGQVLDLAGEKKVLDAAYIHRIQELKTGALLSAGCVMGTIIGGGGPYEIDAAKTYAKAVGLAFQTRDDILDVVGEFEKLGKKVGMDGKKNTFVRLYGLDRCNEIVSEQTSRAIKALECFDDVQFLTDLATSLAGRES